MIHECELERRMNVIGQNGNDGLHHSDSVDNDHNDNIQ